MTRPRRCCSGCSKHSIICCAPRRRGFGRSLRIATATPAASHFSQRVGYAVKAAASVARAQERDSTGKRSFKKGCAWQGGSTGWGQERRRKTNKHKARSRKRATRCVSHVALERACVGQSERQEAHAVSRNWENKPASASATHISRCRFVDPSKDGPGPRARHHLLEIDRPSRHFQKAAWL